MNPTQTTGSPILSLIAKLLTGFLLIGSLNGNGQNQNFPKEINLVFDYLINKDYPESFKGKESFQFRPVGWQILDIDDDGITEVFLQCFPHFTQSPTITVFQIHQNDSVTRIIEGFAPGHLLVLSKEDDYFSPHSTATAIDMQLDSNEPEKLLTIGKASLKFGMSVVLYRNFIHTDKRQGKFFLDLSYLDDYASENSCASFQFEKPEQIVAGKISGMDDQYFIAKTGSEFFCYEIKGFSSDGFIDKTLKIIKVPENFNQFVTEEGFIKYKTKKDKIVSLKI